MIEQNRVYSAEGLKHDQNRGNEMNQKNKNEIHFGSYWVEAC